MLRKGTLRDLLESARGDSPVAMNVLDIPLGHTTAAIPPLFDEIATDVHSINLVKNLVTVRDMADTTSWGTAATRNAVSWFHCDDAGLATSVWVQTGSKWWVMGRRKKESHLWDEMSHVDTFSEWEVKTIDGTLWELEAVHLTSDIVL